MTTHGPTCPCPSWRVSLLVLALVWIVILRMPLWWRADTHLDGDLAVDGLTVADLTTGHWRWHFPGTPPLGILPALAALPQALVLGPTARVLVSGGITLYILVVLATYLLAKSGFGSRVSTWSLAPLAFTGPGLIWLSGRITGGHLLSAAFHAAALAVLAGWLRGGTTGSIWPSTRGERVGRSRDLLYPIALGLACGLALWNDPTAVFTLLAVGIGARLGFRRGWARRVSAALLVFMLALAIGLTPRVIGARADPYDAYREQLVTIFHPINPADGPIAWRQAGALTLEHLRILGAECLPRLVAGARWPGLERIPSAAQQSSQPGSSPRKELLPSWGMAALGVGLALFAAAFVALGWCAFGRLPADDEDGRIKRALAAALIGPSLLVLLAFIVNRNIFNSDNYRYLVLLVVPYAIGFGLCCEWLAQRSWGWLAMGLVAVLAVVMTIQTCLWYTDLGWLSATPAQRDPLVGWLARRREVRAITGSYWDVYPLAFRLRAAGLPMRAVPWPGEPNRFDDRGPEPRTWIVTGRGLSSSVQRRLRGGQLKVLDQVGATWILEAPSPEEETRP